MEQANNISRTGIGIVKFSPLWYCMMCMTAFCEGDSELAGTLYDMGQEVLRITGSEEVPIETDIVLANLPL